MIGKRISIHSATNHSLSVQQWSKLSGLALVVALHGLLLYVAMSYKLIPPPQVAVTVFVNLINPLPKKAEPPPESPKPIVKKVRLVQPQAALPPPPEPLLVSNTPVIADNEPVPPHAPVVAVTPPPDPLLDTSQSPSTVTLSSNLSVVCPQRPMPNYPMVSRRRSEHGLVVLRVELDEAGRIITAQIKTSSGHKRLDEAALATVKHWQCNAPVRDGRTVRAVALQLFDFILEGQ